VAVQIGRGIMPVEIEQLPSDSEEEEDVSVSGGAPETSSSPLATHPAFTGGERIALRHLEPELSHPGSVRVVEKSGPRALELKEQGNALFKSREFGEAVEVYSEALDFAPETDSFKSNKAVFFSNRAACFMHMEMLEESLEDCTEAIELDPRYVKAYMRRAKVLEQMDQLDEALADLKKVVEIDPLYTQGVREHARVEAELKEKTEKMKEEMLGKLKDLGNTVLGKFGMSLDNFQAVQDPETGSYSISFKQ